MTQAKQNSWHLRPTVTLGIIVLLFGIGGWVKVQDWRVNALEDKVKEHSQVEMHPEGRARMSSLETHMSYVRAGVKEIKEIVQRLERQTRPAYNPQGSLLE